MGVWEGVARRVGERVVGRVEGGGWVCQEVIPMTWWSQPIETSIPEIDDLVVKKCLTTSFELSVHGCDTIFET